MLERDLLLSLMRRVRRRRRWTAALEGGAFAATVGALALAAAVVVMRRGTGTIMGLGKVSAALLVLVVIGAITRAVRGIPLHACARSVDRLIAASGTGAVASSATGGDCILAAVSFVEGSSAPTPFIEALVTHATARIRETNLRRAVPPPRPRVLVFAAGAMAVLAVSGLAPLSRSRASDKTIATNERRLSRPAPGPRIRLDGAALDAEFEDLRRARAAGRDTADAKLARLADEFQRLLTDLSKQGIDAAGAVTRIQDLLDATKTDADLAAAARTAVAAAASTSGAARNVGNDGTALATALNESAPTSDSVASEATDRLAGHGEAGRAALGKVAEAAARALANTSVGIGLGGSLGSTQDGDSGHAGDQQNPRRLARPSDSSSGSNESSSTQRRPRDAQRHLEHIRRDLDETTTTCHKDPQACQERAENTGRALGQLQREGRTAEARNRLAEAVGQLLERIRRTGAASGDPTQLRRFARSARGLGVTQPGSAPPPTAAHVRRQDGNHAQDGPQNDTFDSGDTQAESASTTNEDEPSTVGNSPGSGGETEGSETTTTGGGIGSEPGGRVLGARSPDGTGAGRDAPMTLRTDSPGPSRAEIIGGATARGFAATAYRQVFADYHAAVEESLDATSVPPGRRYLVRRYFQLIRPRPSD